MTKSSTPMDLVQDFPSLGRTSMTRFELRSSSAGDHLDAASKPEAVPVVMESLMVQKTDEGMDDAALPEGLTTKERKKSKKKKPKTPPALLAAFGAKQRSVEEINRMGIFLKNPSMIKKGRQRLGPRKKRLSVLKKKVLQERLAQWNAINEAATAAGEAPTGEGQKSARTVAVLNFCVPEETQDEEELEEIVLNLRDMAVKLGEVQDVYVDQLRGHAFCRFPTSDLAHAAHACWNGLIVGGERLVTKLVSSVPTDETWRSSLQDYEPEDDGEATDGMTTVILENILTQDDLEDEECLKESLEDIRNMAADVGTLVEIKVVNQNQIVLTYHGKQTAVHYFDGRVISGQIVSARLSQDVVTSVMLLNVLTEDDLEDDDCLEESLRDLHNLASRYGVVKDLRVKADQRGAVIIQYDGDVDRAAACSLCGHIIGGRAIQAEVLQQESIQAHRITLYNLLTESDYEDEDCLAETKADVAELGGRFGRVVRIEVNHQLKAIILVYNEEADVVDAAVEKFNCMVIGGQTVTAIRSTTGGANLPGGSAIDDLHGQDEVAPIGPLPMLSGDKLIPEKYAAMKRVPKVPNSGIPRSYATLVNDEAAKPLLIDMLSELMRLQKRAVEEQNTKAKRRLLMGLREVARGIRSHKVKMVVMANNLDEYGAMDEKLQEIVDLARDERVPVFYEFNKRGLGKAIGKSIKIGVVGVQNADGAQQQLKRLLSIATSHGLI